MAKRAVNFAAGPSALPVQVLETAQSEMLNFQNTGMGLMEHSHRGATFTEVIKTAEKKLRSLMAIPDNYKVLFMQGGGTTQFSCVPLNLLKPAEEGKKPVADYIITGTWSAGAAKEAAKYCDVNKVCPPLEKYTGIPHQSTWKFSPDASYVYYCDNETVNGVEFPSVPETGPIPLVADMSSNILTRKVDVSKFGMIFAGAQKNIGCTGVTIVIIREDLIGNASPLCPLMLDYKVQDAKGSMHNTPPTWSIYIAGLVFKWMESEGGADVMENRAQEKADALYGEIERSDGFYTAVVNENARSRVNVPFTIKGGDKEIEARFIAEAMENNMFQLAGHRSVGGLRASLYNATTVEQAIQLQTFMKDFKVRVLAESK